MRPAEAGMFSGSQSHKGKSQNPLAWIVGLLETKVLKPIDKIIFKDNSELSGRNESECIGGSESEKPQRSNL